MTKVIDWKRAEDPRDVVHLAVQALAEGHLVAFPSDANYVIAAGCLRPAAIDNLRAVLDDVRSAEKKGATQPPAVGSSPAIVPRSSEELLDYSPTLSPVAARMARRLWPGPVVIRLDVSSRSSLVTHLSPMVQSMVVGPDGYAGFTIPGHESLAEVLRLTSGPLMVVNPIGSFADESKRAEQVDGRVALAIDDGLVHAPAPWASIRIDGVRCQVEHPGKQSVEELISGSQFKILLVCTGNTCRSPMAEQLLKRKLKARFPEHFSNSQLSPIEVASAGVSAYPGGPASDGAIAAMAGCGLDLTQHESRPTTQSLVERADLILTMTNNHRLSLLGRWPHLASKTFGLAGEHADVSDPYGGTLEVYQACAQKMDGYLEAWLNKLDQDTLPIWSVTGTSGCF